jgi:hypothetical protein
MKHIAGLLLLGLLSLPATFVCAQDSPAAPEQAAEQTQVALADADTLATFASAKAEMAQRWGVDKGDSFALLTLCKYTLVTAESDPVAEVDPAARAEEEHHLTITVTDERTARLWVAAKAHLSAMAGRDLTDEEAVRRMSKLYVGGFDAYPSS